METKLIKYKVPKKVLQLGSQDEYIDNPFQGHVMIEKLGIKSRMQLQKEISFSTNEKAEKVAIEDSEQMDRILELCSKYIHEVSLKAKPDIEISDLDELGAYSQGVALAINICKTVVGGIDLPSGN